jgi:hypothetical protein
MNQRNPLTDFGLMLAALVVLSCIVLAVVAWIGR